MLSKIPNSILEELTVQDLEQLLELKKQNVQLGDLLRERERLRLELRRIEDQIEALERANACTREASVSDRHAGTTSTRSHGFARAFGSANAPEEAPNFLVGKRKKSLKDYIAQVLVDAGEPLSPSEIQRRLPAAGYQSNSTNPRSFYNTVFQALQRYDAFSKEGKKYLLTDHAYERASKTAEILPKNKTRLKDYIIEVLSNAETPLKASEIASRVLIAGYQTDLDPEEVNQRVSATLKKYLNKEFDWDSQRYRLATPARPQIPSALQKIAQSSSTTP